MASVAHAKSAASSTSILPFEQTTNDTHPLNAPAQRAVLAIPPTRRPRNVT